MTVEDHGDEESFSWENFSPKSETEALLAREIQRLEKVLQVQDARNSKIEQILSEKELSLEQNVRKLEEDVSDLRTFLLVSSPRTTTTTAERKQRNSESTLLPVVESKTTNNNDDENESETSRDRRRNGRLYSRFTGFGLTLFAPDNGKQVETLPEDSFSFLIIAKVVSLPYMTALTVLAIQIATYSLLFVNGIDWENPNNPLQIPVNVSATVRATALIAICITVLTQDDIRTGLSQINNGYSRESYEAAFEYASFCKWCVSVTFRCLEGALGIVVTLFLIVKAETVIDLLLNFTAMEFVSQLDEICFSLANQGFLGKRNNVQCDELLKHDIKVKKRKCRIPPIILLVVVMVGMLVVWISISFKQSNGDFLCNTFMVQLGDDFDPSLGAFSGLYEKYNERTGFFSAEKVKYVEVKSKQAMFGYCSDLKAWTFTYNHGGELDPCDWKAKSTKTGTFNLEEAAGLDWLVVGLEGTISLLDPFFMSCYDCDSREDKSRNQCADRGICPEGEAICDCEPDWYGPRCEFRLPCEKVEMDSRYGGFLGTREWPTSFQILRRTDGRLAEAYHRPIYLNTSQNAQNETGFIILFTGRRWVATDLNLFFQEHYTDSNQTDSDSLADYFEKKFHAYFSNFSQSFISRPIDYLTPAYLATPLGVQWYSTKTKANDINGLQGANTNVGTLSAELLCAVCNNETNPCQFEGLCQSDGSCNCEGGTVGTLCQIIQIGNGFCNQRFNTPEFRYDGGDCCESTCESNDAQKCGKDETGLVDIGYPFCSQYSDHWVLKGDRFKGVQFGQPPYVVSLLGNGETLAVGEPNLDRVHVFDKDGSEWVLRGLTIEGPFGSQFGFRVKLSFLHSDPFVVNNYKTKTNVRLLVHTKPTNQGEGSNFYLYDCSPIRCQEIGDLKTSPFTPSTLVDISNNGDVLAYIPNSARRNSIMIRTLSTGNNIQIPEVNKPFAISLSGAGNHLAVGLASCIDPVHACTTICISCRKWIHVTKIFRLMGNYSYQIGEDIITMMNCTDLELTDFEINGNAVSLSSDGMAVAIGEPYASPNPGVRVFGYHINSWIQRGKTLTSENNLFGYTVKLSGDGDIVAVGNVAGEGETTILEWKGNWTLTSSPTGSSFAGMKAALSSNGRVLAIDGQSVAVFQYPKTCANGMSKYKVSLFLPEGKMDFASDFVLYVFGDDDGKILFLFENSQADPSSTLSKETCLPDDQCLLFYLEKKGIQDPSPPPPPANYTIFKNGQVIKSVSPVDDRPYAYEFTYGEFFTVGECRQCPDGSRLVQLIAKSSGPLEWYIRNITNGTTDMYVNGDVAFDTSDEIKTNLFWKDGCVSEVGCFEVAVRGSFLPPPDVPLLFFANQIIFLTPDYGQDYGHVYSYTNCASLLDDGHKSYFKEGFVSMSPGDDATSPPTTIKYDIDNAVCDTSMPLAVIRSADDFCNKTLESGTAYILTANIECLDLDGATLLNHTCLDCRGLSINSRLSNISGSRSFVGIHIDPKSIGAIVNNCGINEFDVGLQIDGIESRILHTEVTYASDTAITFSGKNTHISFSKVTDCNFGVASCVGYDGYLKISGSLMENNNYGIMMGGNNCDILVNSFPGFPTNSSIDIECSVIRNNGHIGVASGNLDLNIIDTILFGSITNNLEGESGLWKLHNVKSCGSRGNHIRKTSLSDQDVFSDLTCDTSIDGYGGVAICNHTCPDSCKGVTNCPSTFFELAENCPILKSGLLNLQPPIAPPSNFTPDEASPPPNFPQDATLPSPPESELHQKYLESDVPSDLDSYVPSDSVTNYFDEGITGDANVR